LQACDQRGNIAGFAGASAFRRSHLKADEMLDIQQWKASFARIKSGLPDLIIMKGQYRLQPILATADTFAHHALGNQTGLSEIRLEEALLPGSR
jgi:hypothetical protein